MRNDAEREVGGGLGTENAYPRDEEPGLSELARYSGYPAATLPRPPHLLPSLPSSLRATAARETGETYIFPLYTPRAHPLQSLTALPNSRNKACRLGSLRAR